MESGMNQGLESGAFIRKKEKNTFAHLNYCNEVFIDLGRKEGPIETALWNTQQVQLSQEGVGKENKYGIKKITKKKKQKKNARKGLYRLEFLRSFELSKWMKCYSYEYTISLAGITLFLLFGREHMSLFLSYDFLFKV